MKKFFAIALAMMMLVSAQLVMAASEEGEPALPIEASKVYPKDLAKDLNYNGTVTINAVVSVDGTVTRTVVMRSSGRPKIDKIAMEAASKWEFNPALDKDGNPMEVWYMIKFESKDF